MHPSSTTWETPRLSPSRFTLKLLLISALSAKGGGFHIAVHDAEAIARGNAVVASIDRPSAVYYNPAGLTQIAEPSLQFGLYSVYLDHELRSVSGERVEADREVQFVPHLYYAHPINDRLTLGAGLNVPFGLETDWSDTSLAPFATKNRVNDIVLSTTFGYQLTDQLAVGLGANLHIMELELGRAPGGIATKYEGDDTALGFIASVQYQINDRHSFGATFHSGVDLELRGDLEVGPFDFDADLDFDLPDTMAIGYQYRPNQNWSFEVNVEYIRWDQLNSYLIDTEAPLTPADRLVPFEWKDSLMYEVGCTRYFENGWRASLGYVLNENSQPDSFTFTPAVADADRYWLSAGVSYDQPDFNLALAYQYGFSDREIANSFQGGANGKYKTRVHTVSLEASWKF